MIVAIEMSTENKNVAINFLLTDFSLCIFFYDLRDLLNLSLFVVCD